MRVFVAGATGVIGQRLVPRLIEAGHTVIAMTRNLKRAEGLEEAVRKAKPDVVIHQLTALPKAIDPRKMEKQLAPNDRIRTEGTRNLVRAAALAGAHRIVAQSVSFVYTPEGGPVKDEDAPLWLEAPWPWRRSVEAVAELERQVRSAEGMQGVVLRCGYFYGPGMAYAEDGSVADLVRARQLPVGGRGSGVFSFVHVDDAASATILALEHGQSGIYNVADDEPALLREWLPVYAKVLNAPTPRRVPGFRARLVVGRYGVYYLTEQRGASNAKAKRELGWSPAFPTWRTGFTEPA